MDRGELKRAAREVADAIADAMHNRGSAVGLAATLEDDGPDPVVSWLKLHAKIPLSWEERREGIPRGHTIEIVPRNRGQRVGNGAIPTRIAEAVIEHLGTYTALRGVCTVESEPVLTARRVPLFDDTGNAADFVGGGIDMEHPVEPAVSSVSLGCYTLTSKPVVLHNALLRDVPLNLVRILSEILAERIGRKANYYFTHGTGVDEPRGLLASTGGVPTLAETAESDKITLEDLLAIYHAVDENVRSNAVWVMHTRTLLEIAKLSDANDRPFFMLDPKFYGRPQVFGCPVVENPDMPTIAPGAKVIVFGDLKRYLIRERSAMRLQVLTERFAHEDSTGVISFYDFDAALLATANTKAIGCLKMKDE